MDRHSDQYDAEDMEEVGRKLIDTLHSNRESLKGWYPADCPTEIVVDLINARDEATPRGLNEVMNKIPEPFYLIELRNLTPRSWICSIGSTLDDRFKVEEEAGSAGAAFDAAIAAATPAAT